MLQRAAPVLVGIGVVKSIISCREKRDQINLPVWARSPLLGLYAKVFSCNLEEAEVSDFREYTCLQAVINSPADSVVLSCGSIDENGFVEQVKGITYSVEELLGGKVPSPKSGNKLFHCILYLAPGDYHHFHSPASWNTNLIRHIPGALLSVAPSVAQSVRGLFSVNERVIVSGEWDYGPLYFCAVGAYNVGSIFLSMITNMTTNTNAYPPIADHIDYPVSSKRLQKGEEVGAFRLGSSIVLIFEAPETFSFSVKPGQKLRYGEALG
eukprot:gene2873-8152_t